MTNRDDVGDVRRMLEGLESVDAASARAERIRHRAHSYLSRAHARRVGSATGRTGWMARLEPAVVASASVVFLSEVVRRALWLWTP